MMMKRNMLLHRFQDLIQPLVVDHEFLHELDLLDVDIDNEDEQND